MYLSNQIKKLRAAKKMTLAVMAERIGVTTSTVAAYENGSRCPSLDVLMNIARLFNVSTDYLLGFGNIQEEKDRRNWVDISALTLDQRDAVRLVVDNYKKFNELVTLAFDLDYEDIEETNMGYWNNTVYDLFLREIKQYKPDYIPVRDRRIKSKKE